jgi:hypothetical protein
MSSQSALPQRIEVRITRAPIGVWVADSPDLSGFVVLSNKESSLRAFIGEQIASACRAWGFEVDTSPVGVADNNTFLWAIAIRRATPASGPCKVGEMASCEAERAVSNFRRREALVR